MRKSKARIKAQERTPEQVAASAVVGNLLLRGYKRLQAKERKARGGKVNGKAARAG